MALGYSHPIKYHAPEGIELKTNKMEITVNGIDKQLVGQVAAEIRSSRWPWWRTSRSSESSGGPRWRRTIRRPARRPDLTETAAEGSVAARLEPLWRPRIFQFLRMTSPSWTVSFSAACCFWWAAASSACSVRGPDTGGGAGILPCASRCGWGRGLSSCFSSWPWGTAGC